MPKKIIYTADIQMTKKYISLMLTSIYIIDILSPSNQGKLHETLRSTIRREAGPWNTKPRLVRQSGTSDDGKIPNRPCRRSQSDRQYTGSTLAIGEVNDQGKMGARSTFQLATSDKCVIEMHVSRATNVLGIGEILDRRD